MGPAAPLLFRQTRYISYSHIGKMMEIRRKESIFIMEFTHRLKTSYDTEIQLFNKQLLVISIKARQ